MVQPKPLFRLRVLIASLFLFLGLVSPLSAVAQSDSNFELTDVNITCLSMPGIGQTATVNMFYSYNGEVASGHVSVHNTSSNYTEETELSAVAFSSSPGLVPLYLPSDQLRLDMLHLSIVMAGEPQRVFEYTAMIEGSCGSTAFSITGGLVADDDDSPEINIGITDATCSGFNWSVTSETDVIAYVFVMDILGRNMVPVEPHQGTSLYGTESFNVTDENQTNFNIHITVHDPVTSLELASKSLIKDCPIETPGPTTAPGTEVTAEGTVSVTPDVDERTRVVIQIEMPGGASIEGAPFSVFAPMAAQFAAEPYQQGVVGPNNTIVVFDLIEGQYRLVVEPAGMAPFEVVFAVGATQVTEVMVVVDADGNASVAPGQITQTPTAAPENGGAPATSGGSGDNVSGLPSTGSGGDQSAMPVMLFALVTVLIGIGGFTVVRQSTSRR